ncbi:HNH endonuclease [Flavobacteriaceae bacterium]|nr:HNH endonuclease [Flavobacteriaceae bacterium]
MTKTKELPSVAYLKECFDYNPESGELVWRVRPLHHFQDERTAVLWNAKHDGKPVVCKSSHGYTRVGVNGVRYYAHRIAWKMHTGKEPVGELDHINGAKSDNRASNLRLVSKQENARNQKMSSNNTSGMMGVHFDKSKGGWSAYITHEGVRKNLGLFTDKIDAIYARYYAERDHGFHQNHGRV